MTTQTSDKALLKNLEAGTFFIFEGETDVMVVREASQGTDEQGDYTLANTRISDWASRNEFCFWGVQTVSADERVIVIDKMDIN